MGTMPTSAAPTQPVGQTASPDKAMKTRQVMSKKAAVWINQNIGKNIAMVSRELSTGQMGPNSLGFFKAVNDMTRQDWWKTLFKI